jgi:hypothetical protein
MHRSGKTKLRALEDPRILERIREAEARVQDRHRDDEDLMSVDELGLVIADLRAGRRPAILEDSES